MVLTEMKRLKKIIKQEDPFYVTEQDPVKFNKKYLANYNTLYCQKKVEEILKLMPKSLKGKKVLDYGCGGGYFSVLMAKRGAKVVGVDTSTPCLKAARYYAKKEGIDRRCEFRKGELGATKREKFDFVLCKDVIEHVENDLAFLKTLGSFLGNSGVLLLTTQNSSSFNYFFEGLIRKLLGHKKWVGWDSTHLRFYNHRVLKKMLKDAGFVNLRFASSYFIPYLMLTKAILGRDYKFKGFTLIDDHLGHKHPFNKLGWSISVYAEKG